MNLSNIKLEEQRIPIILFNVYRIVLASIFILILFVDLNSPLDGIKQPGLLKWSLFLYTTSIGLAIWLQYKSWLSPMALFNMFFIDIVLLMAIMIATGGVQSGFGTLVVVDIAACSILLSRRSSILLAALACSIIVYWEIFNSFKNTQTEQYVRAAFIGLSCFATALMMQYIVSRAKKSQKIADEHQNLVSDLTQINSSIVERIRTGIIVCSKKGEIRTSNESARTLLGLKKNEQISVLPQALQDLLNQWLEHTSSHTEVFKPKPQSSDLQINFTLLKDNQANDILVFIEDLAQIQQQAQQLKLASLGQFTAAIAHEIRNPLGAISHATQLLAESEQISGPDARLLQISQTHCLRMNEIIENILQLSRRSQSQPYVLNLCEWLNEITEEFKQFNHKHLNEINVNIHCTTDLTVRVDQSQMKQVLHNLMQNGLRYSQEKTGQAKLIINAGLINDQQPYLDVIDFGVGISSEDAHRLFEPFYTTDNSGTGLGLYISKELCESNQANLEIITPHVGGCFRITFSHPMRLGNL
ncbi:sensor histidine kinase [Marinicellulosiphila megalodicopiae]|uniref:sensor histidine kinase n=1 Tax=Marinicellulosiphila megalodicopiae TaxID=2724896 RepID=UPI003BAF510C